jgi:uncharacterized protein
MPWERDMNGQPGYLVERVAALVEVLIVFVVAHLSYRSFKHFTDLGRLEGAAGLNFSPGSVMILFTIAMLLLFRRNFKDYGLTLEGWRYNLNVCLLWGVLTVLAAAVVMRSASHGPPDMKKALMFAVGGIAATFLLAWFLMRERRWVQRIPALVALFALIGLLLVPLVLAWNSSFLLTLLWVFFGAGFGEEIFFRGYIQSRLNQAFGRPFCFMRVDFGLGLIVSSLLFGFIHVLNTVDYFTGRWNFAWWWWLPTFAIGLFYGCLREKTGSVLAGGVHHGLIDVMAEVPSLLG